MCNCGNKSSQSIGSQQTQVANNNNLSQSDKIALDRERTIQQQVQQVLAAQQDKPVFTR